MITLDDIPGISAINALQNYVGKNPYIKQLKRDIDGTKVKLTPNQITYIIDNEDKDPIKMGRVIKITNWLGESLQKSEDLSFTPEKLLVEYLLADTEKTYHIWGKLKQNQKESKMYWLPKTQILDDIYFEEVDVDVDFDKYTNIDALERTPFEHQKYGIKFLLGRDGAILADDMGLGKTYQAIIAALETGAERILVVCPSSVKINWEREINAFCNETAIVNGRKWKKSKFTIINYDILKNFHTVIDGRKKVVEDEVIDIKPQTLVNAKFDLVIIDEAHKLKNPKSIRGKIMTDLCVKHGIKKVWLLTGTPIANRPMDYFNLLTLIKAPLAENWMFFAKRYCEGRKFYKTLKNGQKRQIWLTDGASNLTELHLKSKNHILRRLKEDVLDMPDKMIIPTFHKLTDKEWIEYNDLWDEYIEKRREEGKRVNLQRDLVELILLRKFIAMTAIDKTIEIAENAIEQGHKVIIFTTFTDELEDISDHFGNQSVIHYGGMTDVAKQNSIDKFQGKDKIKVFVGNVISAGVGITLTAGDIVIFNSFSWVPGDNSQAEDRAYRIGQENNVTVYYQLFNETVSTLMWGVLNKKQTIIDEVIRANKTNIKEIDLE